MPDVTSHTPGSFSWADLSTPDHAASKAFYTALFGWDAVDNDMGDGAWYSSMQLRGKPVAAIATNSPDHRDAPAEWAPYVTVPDAGATVARVSELGGTVVGDGAFDVYDYGRMAFIADPQGAGLRLWEPRQHIGAQIIHEPNSLAWFELASPDPAAVAPFYSELLGWTIADADGMDYQFATTASGDGTAGIQPASDGAPAGWLVYFWTDDVDATLARAVEHGAEVTDPATDIPGDMGRYAILRDPQRAAFGLFRG